jgi:NADH dehydrogenase/NADH:ubiquinone oxidoreductase subunit G
MHEVRYLHNGLSTKIQCGQESLSTTEMISLKINGKRIKARKGDTVLRIAERAGIRIPSLCYHKDLTPFGGCRLCIVEVKGKKTPLTACTLLAEDGMDIKTDTPRLRRLRRFTMQLILSEHPNGCLVCEREADCANFQECIKKSAVIFGCKSCPRNENCELQDLVRELGIESVPFDSHYRNLEVERYDPFFDRDYNLCILCGRCIRACEEIRNAYTLQFQHRGPDTIVGTAFDLPHLDSGCQFCGACVDVCPTGALHDRFSRYEKPAERSIKTTCMLCSLGCSIDLKVTGDKVICSTPHNNQICVRGRFGIAPLVNHPKRITKPLLKKNGQMVEVEWAQAMEYTAQKLNEHRNRTGVIFSPQLTIEAIDKIYSIADSVNAKISSPVDFSVSYGKLEMNGVKGNFAFVIINTDMIADFSVLLLGLRKKYKDRVLFIVVDAVGKESTRFADMVLKPRPGTEHDLIQALIGAKKAAKISGVPASEFERARSLLRNKKIYLIYNESNFQTATLGKGAKSIPLNSQINVTKIIESGIDDTYENILNRKGTECLYLIGTAPGLHREYKTVIVQDCFLPDFDCDVFLPAATFAETSGSVIDIEGKRRRVRRAVDPSGKSMSDERIIDDLTQAMKINLNKAKKRKRITINKQKTHPKTSVEFPVELILRQNTYAYRNKPLSELIKGFHRLRQDQYGWVNERTAKKYRIKEGMTSRIISARGAFSLPVKIGSEIPDNAILVYYHPSMGHVRTGPVRLECIE